MEDSIWKVVWCKFVPPKVSGFVWKAVHQRLSVSTELCVWKVWQSWCSVWQINIVFPYNVKDLLQINKIRFQGSSFLVDQMFILALVQIGVWAKSIWPSLIQSVQDFVRCPDSIVI
ncbi:hypothetical protein F3Y22_tig00110472pilonHSYRG00107 [Hibiscus syriacus]|uniref:Reverse transcriptase zinc-binding domain-containing protein n=1 Tax=Hibiscus syriacus TaxID=106335 RepID=A0A6A3AKC6_HIBSY|nr:hypothetical protein F3Y22_tig00110472pilonHSYRG00107 [Hibiscus syriacus]